MAFTKIHENDPRIQFDPDGGMAGGASSYFHFVDLELLKERHPDAEGFRIINGSFEGKECGILILIKEKSLTGANYFFDKPGDYVAFTCPKVVDTIGGEEKMMQSA